MNSISPLWTAAAPAGSMVSQADGAGGGFGERQALDLDVLRIVVGHHDVDQSGGDRRDQRLAVVLGAQRRRQLQEGAVGADVVFVQRQMIDRGRGGDIAGRRRGRACRISSDSTQVSDAA